MKFSLKALFIVITCLCFLLGISNIISSVVGISFGEALFGILIILGSTIGIIHIIGLMTLYL